MRYRPMMTLAATAAVIAAMPAHAAGVKTLDGKKVKTLTFADKITSPQENDKDFVALSASDRTACAEPRCTKFSFRYLPAKGVKRGPFSVKISWSNPAEDYDLYVVQDNGGTVGQCGAGAGTSEAVVIAKPLPKHVYTIVVDHYRALPDTVAVNVQFPTQLKIATTVPSPVENNRVFAEPWNCALS